MDLSKPLPAGTTMRVFVVFRETAPVFDPKRGQFVPGQPQTICTRLTKDDAMSVADSLNAAAEGVMMLTYVARVAFPTIEGDGEALETAANLEKYRDEWEKIAAPNRQPMFKVVEQTIANAEDVDTIQRELDAAKKLSTKKK